MIKMIAIRVVFHLQMIKTKGKRVDRDNLPCRIGRFRGNLEEKKHIVYIFE